MTVHAWERWAPAWHGAFFLLLGLSSVLALADPHTSWARRGAILALAVPLAGWYWGWAVRGPIWNRPFLHVLAYLAGAATLWVLLLLLHEAFFILAFSAYAQVFGFLPSPRSAIPGAVVLTTVLLVMQGTKSEKATPGPFVVAVAAAGAGILLSLWVDAIMRQSQDRHRLIEELEATRAELAVAERQAGTLGERQRLAREIHDTLAQGVTSVVTLLEATEAELAPGQDVARRHLGHALRTARDTLAEARRFVWALQPKALDRGSLAEALGRLAETLADETGMTARLLVTGPPQPLSAQAEIALLRAAQEGTANIRKHARATEAVLTLSYLDDRAILDVRDDGRGFDAAAVAAGGPRAEVAGGLGLPGLKARLAMLGGGLDVESTPGEGTVLVAQVPIGAAGPGPESGAVA
ncbi:MAG: sensor histidine kinase [Actinobacteria bacterium]|nr:sensor histidine kinase [Actinomycetota bacterium]